MKSEHFYFGTVTGKIFSKKKSLYFTLIYLEKAFERVPWDKKINQILTKYED